MRQEGLGFGFSRGSSSKLSSSSSPVDDHHARLSVVAPLSLSPSSPLQGYSVPTLDELIEKSRHDAIVNLQRWWRRHHGNQKRVTEFQELCRTHAKAQILKKRTRRIRAKIRELLLHAAFLYFYIASTHSEYSGERLFRFGNAPVAQYLAAEFPVPTTSTSTSASTTQELKSFHRISSTQELFSWLQGPFLTLSYPISSSSSSLSQETSELVFQSNRVVGGIRIGQLRVARSNCASRITTYFSTALLSTDSQSGAITNSSMYCYGSKSGDFQSEDESTESFGGSDSTIFHFAGHNDTDTSTERAKRFSSMASTTASDSDSFPAPAFSVVLPRANSTQASQILQWLENDSYVDAHTRVLMLDLNLYNGMLQYVLVLRFVFEFPASGGVIPTLLSTSAPVTKSFLYNADELWDSVCNLVVLAFYVYFLASELLAHTGRRRKAAALKALKWSSRFGSGARVLSLVFYLLVWLVRLMALISFPSKFPLESDTFVTLRAFTEAFRVAQHLLAVNTCLCWLVLVLLLRVSRNIDVFVRTMLIAKTKLLSLLFCLALVVYGYASAFVVALGAQVQGFESVSVAVTTLIGLAFGIGGADIVASRNGSDTRYQHQDASIAMALFAGFLLLNGVVIANLFLVVIYESYRKAVEELEFQQQQSSHKRVHLVLEIVKYAKALYEQLRDGLKSAYGTLRCVHKAKKKLVTRTSRMSVVRAISSSKAMQKSAKLISSHVGALSDFGGKLMHNVVKSERDTDDEDEKIDARDNNRLRGDMRMASNGRGLLLRSGGGVGGIGGIGAGVGGRRIAVQGGGGGGGHATGGDSANTKLLQGMILQLALQNENLIRSIEEIRSDVKNLAVVSSMDDASRRRLLSPSPLGSGGANRSHSRKQSVAAQQQQHQQHSHRHQVLVEDRVELLDRAS